MASILFYCPQMKTLAERIVKQDLDITLGRIAWGKFEDGWPNIFIPKVSGVRRKNVAFLASLDTPADVFAQLSVIYKLPSSGAQEIKVILPFYVTGTMERADNESQVVTAKTLARMLSASGQNRSGPIEIVLYDVHSLGLSNYFGDNVITRYKSGTKYLKKKLENMDVSIGFPDFGAYKRFCGMFDGGESYAKALKAAYESDPGVDVSILDLDPDELPREGERKFPMVICEKVRDGNKRIVHVKEGEVSGRHVVIIDDLIRTGTTMLECRDALMKAGAAKVSLYSTHGVFPMESWRKFVDAGFERIWITDSCPYTAKAVEGVEPFEILSLDASIARVIAEVQQ